MKITPHTKRIIVGAMGLIGLAAAVGLAVGTVDIKDASIIIMPMMTGFFSLLKGQE